jgi:WD40-like Beta Propeller Repeat
MDKDRAFYFISPRSYDETFCTIYRGKFADGKVSDVALVPGISRKQPGIVNFDMEVSPDGKTLYFVDAMFANGNPVTADLVIADRRDNTFERAANSAAILKNVNSDVLEYAACISADGLTLFFNRAGKDIPNFAAIFVTTRKRTTEPFGKPMRLVAIEGFVEGPTLSPDERSLYYHKKEGGRFVIYRVSKH